MPPRGGREAIAITAGIHSPCSFVEEPVVGGLFLANCYYGLAKLPILKAINKDLTLLKLAFSNGTQLWLASSSDATVTTETILKFIDLQHDICRTSDENRPTISTHLSNR